MKLTMGVGVKSLLLLQYSVNVCVSNNASEHQVNLLCRLVPI
jgi:hypothetical protein